MLKSCVFYQIPQLTFLNPPYQLIVHLSHGGCLLSHYIFSISTLYGCSLIGRWEGVTREADKQQQSPRPALGRPWFKSLSWRLACVFGQGSFFLPAPVKQGRQHSCASQGGCEKKYIVKDVRGPLVPMMGGKHVTKFQLCRSSLNSIILTDENCV